MFERFYNLGVKKKFHIVFSSIIAFIVIGIIIGQWAFLRVQIGGREYKGIDFKRLSVADITAIQKNIIALQGLFYEQLWKYDKKTDDEIMEAIEQTDNLFNSMKNRFAEPSNAGEFYCGSCHSTDTIKHFSSYLTVASTEWEEYKTVLKKKLLPMLASREIGLIKPIIEKEGGFPDIKLMENLELPVVILQGAFPLTVKKMTKEANIIRAGFVVGGILTIGFLIFIAHSLSSLIIKPVLSVSEASLKLANGDFSGVDIDVKSKDEIGNMVASFSTMSKIMRDLMEGMKYNISALSLTSEALSKAVMDLSRQVEDDNNQIKGILFTVSQINHIIDAQKRALQSAEVVNESALVAEGSRDIAGYAVKKMDTITHIIKDTSNIIEKLGNSSQEIGNIVSVIADIADQTNLLALNAAIEAARAGEQGRGFAVVADEVRKLAEKTTKATKEISEKINGIQEKTQKSVEITRNVKKEVESGVNVINGLSQSFDSIYKHSSVAVELTQEITKAINEELSAVEKVRAHISALSQSVDLTVDTINEETKAASELARMAENLKNQMNRFQT